MASFKLIERATNREITINVAQFLLRDNYEKNTNNSLKWVDPDGFTTLQEQGDSFIDKIGLDALLQNEYVFANNPQYYCKVQYPEGRTFSQRSYIDPSVPQNDMGRIEISYTYYGSMQIYVQGSSSPMLSWIPIFDYKTKYVGSGEELPISRYIFRNECAYDARMAFDFIHQIVSYVSPYYWKIPTLAQPSTAWNFGSNMNYIPTLLPKNATYTFNNSAPNKNNASGIYGYPSPRTFYDSTFPQTYGNLATLEGVIRTLTFSRVETPPNNGNPSNTDNWSFPNIDYDFFFQLLFDKIPSEGGDPYPDKDPDPSNPDPPPTTGGGGEGTGDKDTDPVPVPPTPDINPISTGAVKLYQMNSASFREFLQYIWSNTFFTAIVKLFDDPMQAIISSHIIGVNVPTNGTGDIIIGNVNTKLQANIVSNPFINVDFGSIKISQYYGDSSDYESVIQLYLPYYGYVTLNTHEVMNSTINLQYNIDVLTGSFVAFIKVSKSVDGTNLSSVLYQYNGMMVYQIPMSSNNFSSIVNGIVGLIEGQPNVNNFHAGYQRAGALSDNTGYISVKRAYVSIMRLIHAKPQNFANMKGYPYMGYTNLGSCVGYTKCNQVFINNVIGSKEETEEIKRLLKEGVIF